MTLKRFAGLLIIASVFMVSCGKKGPSYAQYIPKESTYVMTFDVRSMMEKLEKDSLTVESMMTLMKEENSDADYLKAMEVWKQFKDAGIDWTSKLLLAVPSFDMNRGNASVEVVAGLSDAKKLEDFINKMPEKQTIQKGEGFSYISQPDAVLGWNDKAVIILFNNSSARYEFDGGDNTAKPAGAANTGVEKLKKYFALKKDESIASIDKFTDLAGQKADIGIYSSSASALDGAGGGGPAAAFLPKAKELLEGVYSTSTINFEDGKIVLDGNTYAGKKMADLLKKYWDSEIDFNMIENYPSNNINGVMAFSFKSEFIPAVLKELGLDALANMALAQAGTTAEDITKAFKGDFAVVVSDFTFESKTVSYPDYSDGKDGATSTSYTRQEPSAKVLVTAKIGDKAAFEKLLKIAEDKGGFIRQGNKLVPGRDGVADSSFKYSIGIEGDLLVFSTDANVYSSFVAKSTKIGLSDDVKKTLKGSAFGAFIDVEKILAGIPESSFDSTDVTDKAILNKAKATFKTGWFTSGKFDGSKFSGKGEVAFVDGKKNSLAQLVRFAMYAAELKKAESAKRRAEWEKADVLADSAVVTPVPGPGSK